LGGGYLTHYVEETSLSIRDNPDYPDTWTGPQFNPDELWTIWEDSNEGTEIGESVISWAEPDAVIPEAASLLAPSLALAAGVFVVSGKSAFSSLCSFMLSNYSF
jgi:hypothetical protein